jgi:Helix-turn-helix domain
MTSETTNTKATGVQPEGFAKNIAFSAVFNSKSTVRTEQYERVLQMLKDGEKNTIQLRQGGVIAPAARTKEMREKLGLNIRRTRLCSVWDSEGFCHPRIAFYALFKEPKGEAETVTESGQTHSRGVLALQTGGKL